MTDERPLRTEKPAEEWKLRQPVSVTTLIVLLLAAIALSISARRTEIDQGIAKFGRAAAHAIGLDYDSDVVKGAKNFLGLAFPLEIERRTEVWRIKDFDPADLPWFARIEKLPVRSFDAHTQKWVAAGTETYLVEPFGYLKSVVRLIGKTIEIAVWGTLLALALAIPLAYFGTRRFAPNRCIYAIARATCTFNRAVPEMISGLFFVLMYGVGPVAGILALGMHTSGLLGKFFADDIENADVKPQLALECIGANKIKVLRYAVLPQIMPQVLAYVQYILERNFRMATVLGIVGAGGIGVELIQRWHESQFGHASTILLCIFITVLLMEHATQHVRARLIQA